jgi:hypothetical protein
MPFYRVTRDSGATALRLSAKSPDKAHYPKFQVSGQDTQKFIVIRVHNVPEGTLGLYLGTATSYRINYPGDDIPMVILLVGEERLYFYRADVTLVSDEELKDLEEHG